MPRSRYIPTIIEQTHRGERSLDIYSRLLQDRILFMGGDISDVFAEQFVAQLLFLEAQDPEKEIHIYINSHGIEPGEPVQPALSIYDTMQYIRCPISTICVGQASNVAALLLACGEKGQRFMLPHSRLHLHQPVGYFTGQATDVDIRARELTLLKGELVRLIARHTNRSEEQVAEDIDRDLYLRGSAAVEYGLVDEVLERKEGD